VCKPGGSDFSLPTPVGVILRFPIQSGPVIITRLVHASTPRRRLCEHGADAYSLEAVSAAVIGRRPYE
jgi:hypothetical protein